MHNEDVARLVLQAAGRCFLTSARELCAEAMILGSTDNVTALVIDLRYCTLQYVRALHSARTCLVSSNDLSTMHI